MLDPQNHVVPDSARTSGGSNVSLFIPQVFNFLALTFQNKITGSLQCFSDEFTASQKSVHA